MGNYCNGTATLRGDRDTLDLIDVLVNRLEECADISGFDADTDWLGHIFKEQYMVQGIFYEGGGKNSDGSLELYIRASRTDGEDYFQAMASGLGLTINWVYISDWDDSEHRKECKPRAGAVPWQLRTEDELDAGEDSGWVEPPTQPSWNEDPLRVGSKLNPGPGVQRMNLGGSSSGPFGRLDIVTSPAPADVDTSSVADDCYQHCRIAVTLAKDAMGEPSDVCKTSITGHVCAATNLMLSLAESSGAARAAGTRGSVVALHINSDSMEGSLGFAWNAMPIVAKAFRPLDYATVRHSVELIKKLAPDVIGGDIAVAFAGLGLPKNLW